MNKDKTIRDLVHEIRNELRGLYPDYEIESLVRIMLKKATPLKKNHHIHLYQDMKAEEEHIRVIKDITKQLKSGKPIQQILGETEFYDLPIRVSPQVLIPRQETEELVEWIISDTGNAPVSILDIGTGSGCIAIALARNLPQASLGGNDLSPRIIEQARENAQLNQVEVGFWVQDLEKDPTQEMSSPEDKRWDVIVSNPPYVRESEKKWMHPNVLEHEPPKALYVSDDDPLLYYRRILHFARNHLSRQGWIYFEINEYMGPQMKQLLRDFHYQNIVLKKDLNQKDRMIKAQKS